MIGKTGLEWFVVMGGHACTGLVAEPQVDESTMAELDDYDPRKPEYIAKATEEEVEQTDAHLLARQIAKLEAATAHRKERGGKVVRHYNNVVESMRDKEAAIMGKFKRRGRFSHARVRSEPVMIRHDSEEELQELARHTRRSDTFRHPLPELDEEDSILCDESAVVGEEEDEPRVQLVRACPAWRAPVHDRLLSVPGATQQPLSGTTTLREFPCNSTLAVHMMEGI